MAARHFGLLVKNTNKDEKKTPTKAANKGGNKPYCHVYLRLSPAFRCGTQSSPVRMGLPGYCREDWGVK